MWITWRFYEDYDMIWEWFSWIWGLLVVARKFFWAPAFQIMRTATYPLKQTKIHGLSTFHNVTNGTTRILMVKTLQFAFPARMAEKTTLQLKLNPLNHLPSKKNMYLHRVCFPSEASHVYFTKGITISNAESKNNQCWRMDRPVRKWENKWSAQTFISFIPDSKDAKKFRTTIILLASHY